MHVRTDWERTLFGDSYDKAKPFDRCKYGALNVTNDYRGVEKRRALVQGFLLFGPLERVGNSETKLFGAWLEEKPWNLSFSKVKGSHSESGIKFSGKHRDTTYYLLVAGTW